MKKKTQIEVELEHQIDWSLTTWEGARRDQIRRWSELPLDVAIAAVEEMEEVARYLQGEIESTSSTGSK
jgi:hypothetical protein